MRQAIILGCFLLTLFAGATARANQPEVTTGLSSEQSSNPKRDELLLELTQVKLNKAAAVLGNLEKVAGKKILPLFQTMLEGALYYDRDSRQLMAIRKSDNGILVGTDILTGESLGEKNKSEIKKVRVNNRLRTHLRGAIARINLKSGSSEERHAAVLKMLDDLSPAKIELLQSARSSETEDDIKELIDLALAMNQLNLSDDRQERLTALSAMAGRLEAPVRNQLRNLVENTEEQDVVVKAAAAKALKKVQGEVEFYGFIEQVFFGLSLGSVLLLVAIGLAITFGVMGVINMAHGEMIMLGAYTTYVVQLLMPNLIEYSLWVAIPAAFLVSGAVGVLIERCVIRYLHGRPLETLLATFGISLILQQTVRTIFSPLNRQVATPDWMSGSLEINAVLSFTYNRLYILIFALLVFIILQLILKKTSLGLNVRAVSQNRDMAKAMGIRTEWVDAMTFGLGSGIAGVAGVALSQLTNVGPNLGQAYIIDSFMVVVFGGVGNLLGTLVGGFSLGMANKFLEPATGAVLANILVLVFIILFIQKRPKGLFPQKGRAAE